MKAASPKPKPYSLVRSRRVIQLLAVVGSFAIGLRHLMPGEESTGGSFDAFCAFGGVETLLPYLFNGQTLKTTNLLNFTVLIGVLGVSLVAGRAFCGWLCPLGVMQDMFAGWARRLSGGGKHIRGKRSKARFPLTLPSAVDKTLRYAKYLVLAAILVASLYTIYPPLRTFCPMRAVFGLKITPLLWGVLVIFIGGSLLIERVWCKYLCPLGALLAIFNKISPVRIISNSNQCNSCGRCDIECSMGIKDVPVHLDDPECIRCLECLDTCARDGSLELKVIKP
jgi:polyferredoxin